MRYFFEDYAFDTDRRELHRGADVVSIAPQVFDLLDYLIRNRERVVSKDDLINAVWNGRSVSDAALTTRLNAARAQSAIPERNSASSRHCRARASVSSDRCGKTREVAGPNPQRCARKAALALPDKPSRIAVLPFENMSGDPDQEYFADGMVEDIITALSRFKSLFVIARNSSFALREKRLTLSRWAVNSVSAMCWKEVCAKLRESSYHRAVD